MVVNKVEVELVPESSDEANALHNQDFNSHGNALDFHSSVRGSLEGHDEVFDDTDATDVGIARRVSALWHNADQVTQAKCILPMRVNVFFAQAIALLVVSFGIIDPGG